MKKRIPTMLLAICMVLMFTPTVALAEINTFGDFTVTGDELSGVNYSAGVLTIGTNGSYTIVQTEGTATATTDRIAVLTGVTATITLGGVNINPDRNYHGIDLASTASVDLILDGTNTIKATRAAGIHVPVGATLTIDKAATGTNESCVLNVTGLQWGAAIGGTIDEAAGSITIDGATVNATAGTVKTGASIGGGGNNWMGYGANGGVLTINGGIVNASGNLGAGTNNYNSHTAGGAITITGGLVNAASIGNIDSGSGTTVAESSTNYVKITGGTVQCTNGINPAPRNDVPASGAPVYKTTLALVNGEEPLVNAAVSYLILGSGTYGMDDVTTDASGKLYVYLTVGTTVTAATVDNERYENMSDLAITTATAGTATGYLTKVIPILIRDPSFADGCLTVYFQNPRGSSATLIATAYDDGKMVELKTTTSSGGSVEFFINSAHEYKVFALAPATCAPLCAAAELIR